MVRAVISHKIQLLDYSKPRHRDWVDIQPGTYELEEIQNPRDYSRDAAHWYVIKGTTYGATILAFSNLAKIS